MPRRVLIAVAALLLGAIALSASATWYLAYTEAGLRFVAHHVPEKIGRVELEIGAVHGTIAHGFAVERFRLRQQRVHLNIENIEARLDLLPLLWQTIHVREARAGHALIEVKRRTTPPPKYEPRFLPRMLTIAVDRARIGRGVLVAPNGRRFDVTDVASAGVVRHKTLQLRDATLEYGPLEAHAAGLLRAADPMQLRGQITLVFRSPGQPEWRAAATVAGDLDELGVKGALEAPFHVDVAGAAHELTGELRWRAAAAVRDFSLDPWGGGEALGRVSGTLDVSGDLQGFEARGPLTPAGLGAGVFDVAFEGAFAERTVTARRIEVVHRASRSQLDGEGTIAIVEDGPHLDLRGTWHDFRWPLTEAPPAFEAREGRYTLRGLLPYDYTLEGVLELPQLPQAVPFFARGTLATDHTVVAEATATVFDGRASFTGEAAWSPEERWTFAGAVAGFDPSHMRRDLPGSLGFGFEAGGLGFGAESSLEVAIERLHGRLRGMQVSGSGRMAQDAGSEAWRFERVRLAIGRTRIALDGTLGAVRDLRFTVDAEDLGLLAPESRGTLRAKGTIGGSAQRPLIVLDASGSGVQHRDLALDTFRADVEFDGRAGGTVHADIDAKGFVAAGRRIEGIALDLEGTAETHRVALAARSGDLILETEGRGRFAEGRWDLAIAKLALHDDRLVALHNEQPFGIAIAADLQRLEPVCLRDERARVCAEGESRAGVWSATLSAAAVPLQTLTAGLTQAVTYDGLLDAAAQLSGAEGKPWTGTLRVGLTQAQLAHRRRSGRVDLVTLGSGAMTVNADADTIVAALELDARETGSIRGELSATRTAVAWRDYPLRGTLRVETDELGLVGLYVPEIDRAAGNLAVDVVTGGTLGSPLVSGVLKLRDAELDLYQVNLALRDLDASARLLDNTFVLEASGRAGEGRLGVTGTLRWIEGVPDGEIHFSGESLRVVDVPEARIDASPALDFKVLGRRIDVTGSVRIPEARIVPADLTNAVLPSGDESIVGVERPDPAQSFRISSNIMMTLGERVSIDTFGLKGRITGSVAVRTDTVNETSRGRGELKIEEGEYTALGRRLDIQRGRLLFTGGLLTNPGVDIRAAKQFPDVVAGVNVRGTLQQPRLTFFSEPPIPQSQIVSLILAGGSLEAAQNDPTRGATRSELLSQGGAILAAQLGSRIGLEEVSIESTLDNETALVLGKYLSPRLYVSYGISLTESINTFKARYTLGDRWTLKTESGREQNAELVYTIEK